MSALTDNDEKSKIDRGYEQGSGSYDPQSIHDLHNLEQQSAYDRDFEKIVKDQEAEGGWKTDIAGDDKGRQIDKPKLLKAVGVAKKRGGIIGLVSLFGVGGALLAGFFGPTSMLVNLVENFAISNDSSSTVLEQRFAKVFGHMAESDSQTLCAQGSNITCKMGRLSNKSLKQLSKKGVVALDANKQPINFSKGTYPDKNPSHYEFTANDGTKKNVPANQLRGFLANKDNRKYAAKLLGTGGAFNLRVKAWSGKYIQQKFFNKFSLSKKGGLADGSDKKHASAQEKLKASTEKLLSAIPGVDTLKGVDAKIKTKIGDKLEGSKGGGAAYNVASAYCVATKAPAVISAGVAGVQLARLLPIANDLVLSPGSKLKASGVDKANAVTGGDMDTIGTLLTNKTKNADGKMTSALDSPYLLAALGVNKAKPPVSAKFAPGYSVLTDPSMKALRDEGRRAAPACNAILTPMAMFIFATIESAITKTNPAGAIAGIVGGFVVGAATAPIVEKIVGEVGKAAIEELAKSDNLENLQGEELGDALGVSAAAFFAAGSMARNIPTLTESQVVAFNSLRNENETLQKEMDIASLSPFDTSSRYTLLGSIVHTMQMGVLTSGSYNGSPVSILGSLVQLPQSLLSTKVSAANYTENSCSYADSFDLSGKEGTSTPAINMAGLPCTGITAEQAVMEPSEAATIMIEKGWVDGSKEVGENATIDDLIAQDIIKKDTPLSAYIESCSDASTGDYIIDAPGCTVKPSVTSGQPTTDGDWSTDQYCKNDKGENTCGDVPATSAQQTEDTRAFAAMAVFLLDFQEVQIITGQDEEEAGSGSSSSTTLENSGKINPEGWAYPLDSPKTLVTYSPHNGDDIGTPIGSKVYSMREGTVLATETQSVAEIEALGFCNLGFTKINGPQKNLMIESIVNGKKYTIRYAHLSEFKVKVGDTVKAGDFVALSGDTGCVTAQGDPAHLHVDINAGEIYPRDVIGTSF